MTSNQKISIDNNFILDYARGTLGYRLTPKRVMHEPLAKVIDKDAWVFDATGGILRDAIIMTLLGCKVWAAEAHPLIAVSVRKSLDMIKDHPVFKDLLFNKERFQFFAADSLTILDQFRLQAAAQRPDIVYLDPMFPRQQKTKLAKKEMQWLQEIHACTESMYPHYRASSPLELLLKSLDVAQRRVVVKRPIHAQSLSASLTPSFSKNFQSARFDVYVIAQSDRK